MGLCSSEKKLLVEEIGIHLESTHQLPPLACRIYAIMIVSSDDGFSFEELKEILQCSKSSLSASVNLLSQLNYIEYYTKPGERKRYFRGTGSYLSNMLEENLQKVDIELKMVSRILEFNRMHNPEKFVANQSLGGFFQDYLHTQKENLKSTLDKMGKFLKESSSK
ncbi:Winged helix DNA-binding domain-containing protein [Nonlabens sp. Hel1_33_55]|uniref:GbsR/MarR family transcriptional regulator n=1 Tax=Nonlabens sp. Hel1_33_55 TaxID=1336802 RepID=UPI000875B602|nr:transcriptional regulator [Nonlabens sp. Hel1_33_55]SCY19946.1 Winged helix DNA-binding domain-containing protein [Nonlabens sp. Hel1_33_55]